MLVDRQPTTVLFVACADELPEIRAAWERLEAVAPLRGEPPEVYDRIAGAVEALGPGDPARPVIEHYRRRDEIDVLMPV